MLVTWDVTNRDRLLWITRMRIKTALSFGIACLIWWARYLLWRKILHVQCSLYLHFLDTLNFEISTAHKRWKAFVSSVKVFFTAKYLLALKVFWLHLLKWIPVHSQRFAFGLLCTLRLDRTTRIYWVNHNPIFNLLSWQKSCGILWPINVL